MIELVSYFVSSEIIHPFFELGTLEFAWKLEVHIESPKMLWKFFYIFLYIQLLIKWSLELATVCLAYLYTYKKAIERS